MRPSPPRPRFLPLLSATLAFASACGGDAGPRAGPEVVRDTVADTLVVRTLSGSVWGAPARLVPELAIGELDGPIELLFGRVTSLAVGPEGTIYVVDRQGPDLRAFAADGSFLGTFGRPGEGPGELKRPDGGLAVLSDRRVLVRDPGNARIQVYGPGGEALATWPIRGGFNTSSPLYLDREDHVYTQILVDPTADVGDWVVGLVRIGPDGEPGDTIIPPDAGYEAPYVEARREEDGESVSVSRSGVPFSPGEEWTFHPDGYFVHGISTEYRFTLLREESPVRVERTYDPVPVTGGETSEEELRMIRNMRFTDPNWRWNGPPIPDVKPAFRDLWAGRDGRIWVRLSTEGVKVEDPDYDPTDPDAVADEWREGVAFDVFEDDGTYLGRVDAPIDFQTYPTPVFDGEKVWATTEDELGVIRIVRFRIERAEETQ